MLYALPKIHKIENKMTPIVTPKALFINIEAKCNLILELSNVKFRYPQTVHYLLFYAV